MSAPIALSVPTAAAPGGSTPPDPPDPHPTTPATQHRSLQP
jgi:hypothetical protein